MDPSRLRVRNATRKDGNVRTNVLAKRIRPPRGNPRARASTGRGGEFFWCRKPRHLSVVSAGLICSAATYVNSTRLWKSEEKRVEGFQWPEAIGLLPSP